MADAALAVVALLALGAGVSALGAVLDGARTGTLASIAVLAPLAEGSRLLRTRGVRSSAPQVVAGLLLLSASVVRVLVPVIAGPVGVGAFLLADALWWIGGTLLAERRGAFLRGALAVEAPLVLALAAPAVAARSLRIDDVVDAQQGLPFAAQMPVAFLLVIVIGGVLLPWALPGERQHLRGAPRLLVGAALAAQPVSASTTASVLLLGLAGGWAVVASAVLAAVVVVVARRFPALRLRRLVRPAVVVLLPLALVQLAVVIALAVLGG